MKTSAIGCCLLLACYIKAQPSLTLPGNLKAEGIPPIPVSLVETLNRYNESRAAVLLDWHPTRREMLISTRFGDVPQVHRVAMPGGARTQLTFFPDRILGALFRPSAEGESFVFSKDVGGGEFYQIYSYELETGESKLITDGKSRNTGPLWSNDGHSLVYSSTRRNGKDTDLYVVDPSDPKSTRLLLQVEGGGWLPLDWSPDDKTLVVEERRSIADSSLYLVNVSTGSRELLTPKGEKVSYSNAQFTRDGNGLYMTTDRDSEFSRLAFMDLASRRLNYLRPEPKWDIVTLDLSKDGRRLAYLVDEEGVQTVHVRETQTREEMTLPKLPAGNVLKIRWHDNGRDLGVVLSSAQSPGDVYSIDCDKGTLERWTTSETGNVNSKNFAEPELIRWKSFDGRMISGFLYRPPQKFSGHRPVIINIHGGPESQFQPTYLGRSNYYLNELGVVMIYPNVRGSMGFGKTFLTLDNGVKREDSVKDIGALLDWISTQSDLDSARVMVTGASYGGYMTLATMVNYNDRVRCAVDVVGVSNFATLLEHTAAYRRDLRRVEYGDERDPEMRAFLLKISPSKNARQITKPIFIVAGKNDPRVPVTESEQMVAAIRKNQGIVWFLMAQDEGHGFAKKQNQDVQFAATALFVKQFLLGGS